MRILFTGATSFTGMWFVEGLVAQGHDVVAAIRGDQRVYSDLRARRLQRVLACSRPVWGVEFGSEKFIELIEREGPFDVLCHHAAEARDYKSPDFDAVAAAGANCNSLRKVLRALSQSGCRRIVLTGSVFEADEGAGSQPLRAFSAYGLSKTLTAQIFSFHAREENFSLEKFVIPNPFGPYEEPRFTDYLMRCWKESKAAKVSTPLYVRDNIHVSLLSAAYTRLVDSPSQSGFSKTNPSGYVETQGAFSSRFAREMGHRLDIATPLEFADQSNFSEPLVRINTDLASAAAPQWAEESSWDELARYYAQRFDLNLR
jgi:UDP-glucose 4-epimerase